MRLSIDFAFRALPVASAFFTASGIAGCVDSFDSGHTPLAVGMSAMALAGASMTKIFHDLEWKTRPENLGSGALVETRTRS